MCVVKRKRKQFPEEMSLNAPIITRGLETCLSVCLSVYLSVCLSVCLSCCLSVCLSVCLSD